MRNSESRGRPQLHRQQPHGPTLQSRLAVSHAVVLSRTLFPTPEMLLLLPTELGCRRVGTRPSRFWAPRSRRCAIQYPNDKSAIRSRQADRHARKCGVRPRIWTERNEGVRKQQRVDVHVCSRTQDTTTRQKTTHTISSHPTHNVQRGRQVHCCWPGPCNGSMAQSTNNSRRHSRGRWDSACPPDHRWRCQGERSAN